MKITITADGRNLTATTNGQPLTSGSVGIEAAFVLSADYDGLAVTAVFKACETQIDVLLTGPSCIVPWEVLQEAKVSLFVGVVGKNGSGEIVIPTIWGRVGMIECGAVAEGLDPQDPTPDIAAQLLQIAQETVERAETAETAATEAAEAAGESATAAGEAKTDAETAAQDAEAAQGGAEAAQAGAEAAQGAAEAAQAGAEAAQAGAEAAQAGAEVAQGGAETAQAGAEVAQGGAENAQQAAESARDAAASSATGAAGSATTAAQQAQAAASARAAAEAAQQASETARDAAASSATGAAGSATTAAQQAQAAAAARAAAEAAQQAAEEAKTYAQTFTGAPRAAGSAFQMTDTSLIYVYTGATSGTLINGHWYYWDGSAWADGGVYNSTAVETDTSLTVSGAPADAKATGDAVGDLKSAFTQLVNDEDLTNSTYGVKYFFYPLKAGSIYKFTNLCSNTVAIGTADTDGGTRQEVISAGLNPNASVTYTATNDRSYVRIYYNVGGTVKVSELSAKNTQLLTTSPYHKLLYKYDAKALGGNTDDDVAIQNYVNDELYVFLPAGNYKLKNPITITKVGQVIEGESYGFKTILRPYDNTVTSLINASVQNPSSASLMMTLRNICFRMVNDDSTVNPNPAITSSSFIIDSKIENCWFNGGNDAIAPLTSKAISLQAVHTMFLGCWFEMFDLPVEIINTNNHGNSNGFVFSNCTFWNNTNGMKLNGIGTVRGCNFSAMKGGYVLKSDANSKVIFSDNIISLSAASDLSATTYPTANGILFEANNADVKLYIRDIDVFDTNDGSSYYEYLLNAPSGAVDGRNINSLACEHLLIKNNTNAKVHFVNNLLEDVCGRVQYTGNRAILKNLLPNCAMEVTGSASTRISVNNKNIANIPDKTMTVAGWVTSGASGRQGTVISAGNYNFSMNCSGYTSGKQYTISMRDAEGNSIYSSGYKAISSNPTLSVSVPSNAAFIVLYVDSAGTYSNIMLVPEEITDNNYVESNQRIVEIADDETVRIPQLDGDCIVMSYSGELTINAIQTPINYVAENLIN